MSRRLILSDAASDNLSSITHYIAAAHGRETAKKVYEGLFARCERLASLPGILGTARPDLAAGLRSTPHKGYILYFRYTDDALEIVNVLDARRDTVAHFATEDREF